ncbi:hypothetical protein O181_006819 [Austropuccinia psidii MF-1]|uniref:Uncharacterized protein n=1 Tax=Austropuccinia psidii MF-1 TaxID=1389203 RepID=A0A9Q3BKR7_9BASI|nr:hypothetical protein [Austropuccinia psidii MF-1]
MKKACSGTSSAPHTFLIFFLSILGREANLLCFSKATLVSEDPFSTTSLCSKTSSPHAMNNKVKLRETNISYGASKSYPYGSFCDQDVLATTVRRGQWIFQNGWFVEIGLGAPDKSLRAPPEKAVQSLSATHHLRKRLENKTLPGKLRRLITFHRKPSEIDPRRSKASETISPHTLQERSKSAKSKGKAQQSSEFPDGIMDHTIVMLDKALQKVSLDSLSDVINNFEETSDWAQAIQFAHESIEPLKPIK